MNVVNLTLTTLNLGGQMLKQKIQNFLIIASIMGAVILSFQFLIGFDDLTVQAQNNASVFQQQRSVSELTYQTISTDTFSSSETLDGQELQIEEANSFQDIISKIEAGSTEFGPQSINAGYEYIPASAFRHDGVSPASGYSFFPFLGFIQNTSASQMCLAAPVYVPNGATFTNVFVFFVDDSATSDFRIALWRKSHRFPSGDAESVAIGTLIGIDDSLVRVGFFDPFQPQPGTGTVSNDYGYSVTFCFAPNTGLEQQMYGFIISYR